MRIHHVAAALTVGIALAPASAAAQPTACSQAYERAQEERARGGLKAAVSQLRTCTDQGCPKFIRDDCTRWLEQVEASLPSVVFAVRRDGVDQTQVEVTCDGATLVTLLDGKAVHVDPGPHTFSFSIPGLAPVEQQLLIREGERNRMVDVEFQSSRPVMTSDLRSGHDRHGVGSRRYWSYGLAGAGAAGLAGFTLFAVLGSNQQSDLEKSCSPNCQAGQVDSVKTKYLVADVCLGVGLAALGAATFLFFTSRGASEGSGEGEPVTTVGFIPQPGGAGGVLQLSRVF